MDRNARQLRIDDGALRPVVEVDICIPELRLIVEYDGRYFHAGREVRDAAKTARLTAAGMRIVRVREVLPALDPDWDVEVDETWTPDEMANAVLKLLEAQRAA